MRFVLEVILVLAAIFMVALGIWLLAHSRLPSWMKGIWKWPLGENLSANVVQMMGWASVLAGAACLPTAVVLALWDQSRATHLAQIGAAFLVGAGLFGFVWSVALSRSKPA